MNETSWIILRCSGANTLKLTNSLKAEGFDAWTPVETLKRREGASRSRRKETLPVMPSYIFARARHLYSLLAMSQDESNPNSGFTVFRHFDRIPLIADHTLDPLRAVEFKTLPKDQLPRFTPGELVKVMENGFGFQGLQGVVELTKGKYTLVAFADYPLPIKIKSLHLKSDVEQPIARAA